MAKKINQAVKAMDANGNIQIFDTIAEAARSLKIDASNIRKVLVGSRKRAGKYSFSYTSETPTTKIGKKTRKTREEAAARREVISKVHDRLKELNVRYRNAVKSGTYKGDPIMQQMMAHTDYFGATKTGGFNISRSNLNKFSKKELENLLYSLEREEDKYKKLAEKKGRGMSDAALAALFGITEKQVKEYRDTIPALFDLLHLIKEDSDLKYKDVQTTIFDSLQSGIDSESVEDFLESIRGAYEGNDTDSLETILDLIENANEYADDYS